jgi:hypothetical protein
MSGLDAAAGIFSIVARSEPSTKSTIALQAVVK